MPSHRKHMHTLGLAAKEPSGSDSAAKDAAAHAEMTQKLHSIVASGSAPVRSERPVLATPVVESKESVEYAKEQGAKEKLTAQTGIELQELNSPSVKDADSGHLAEQRRRLGKKTLQLKRVRIKGRKRDLVTNKAPTCCLISIFTLSAVVFFLPVELRQYEETEAPLDESTKVMQTKQEKKGKISEAALT